MIFLDKERTESEESQPFILYACHESHGDRYASGSVAWKAFFSCNSEDRLGKA